MKKEKEVVVIQPLHMAIDKRNASLIICMHEAQIIKFRYNPDNVLRDGAFGKPLNTIQTQTFKDLYVHSPI